MINVVFYSFIEEESLDNFLYTDNANLVHFQSVCSQYTLVKGGDYDQKNTSYTRLSSRRALLIGLHNYLRKKMQSLWVGQTLSAVLCRIKCIGHFH